MIVTTAEDAPAGAAHLPERRGTARRIRRATGQEVPRTRASSVRALLWSLTLARLAAVPVFVAAALHLQELAREGRPTAGMRGVLAGLLAFIALTDAADGWLARRRNLASQAGAIGDALSDKLAQIAFLALFAFGPEPAFTPVPIWLFVAVLARDLILAGGWTLLCLLRVPHEVVHRTHGRASLVAVFVVLFWATLGLPPRGLELMSGVAVLVIVASTLSYVADAVRGGSR